MDKITGLPITLPAIQQKDGFSGQRQYVLPPALITMLEIHPLLRTLFPTDLGWYPSARYHYRQRVEGAGEHILIFCSAGEGWCELAGECFSIHAHEALLIPRGVPHRYGASSDNPWSIHWVHFSGSSGDAFIHQLPEQRFIIDTDADTADGLTHLFTECFEAVSGGLAVSQLIYCAQVLHHLLGRLLFGNPAFSPAIRTSRFHNIGYTLRYLEDNLSRKLTLEQMADHARLSVSQFAATFKQQTGESPIGYFIQLKMQYACSQLTVTNMTIQQIALELGYDDPYYFSRLFKKVIGVAPQQYRNRA